ncbi:MAG: aromatic-L-amino-acid decarboxylase [Bacteroidetes bacterium]|nr:aromatic-L-amino-acid decarboxylase [Bacteroidota bacterium]
MKNDEFRRHAHDLVDWMADYLEHVERYPVKPSLKPGDITRQLPGHPPMEGEPFASIFDDFREIIVPGMTHWQNPSFFAYFPANSSAPSILAEMLIATLAAQCMSWATSPAATELEERAMEWLREMIGLPAGFTGVIQDTASTATLCSILTAREARSDYTINSRGFTPEHRVTVYCSSEAHSSVEKAVKIAGIGKEHLRKIPVDAAYAMKPDALETAIRTDIAAGYSPLCVIAALGTTGSTAIDPLRAVGAICRTYGAWLHVDAAFAGTALVLPECRWMIEGIEEVDTFVFNPHKWMFTNFDCSAYFVRDTEALIRTFEILPEYLKTSEAERVNNYRDWGIQLGRRFRALKLWFVIRSYGVAGIQEKVRYHLALTQGLAEKIKAAGDFEIMAPVPLNTICFRYRPPHVMGEAELDRLNADLMERLNATGKLFLTHTKLGGHFTLRLVIAQTNVDARHVDEAWAMIQQLARP